MSELRYIIRKAILPTMIPMVLATKAWKDGIPQEHIDVIVRLATAHLDYHGFMDGAGI